MKILAIYDNGGKTLDRYTVITNLTELNAGGRDIMECLALSEGGDGFSQWSTCDYTNNEGSHLGKRVHFEQLSEATQRHIAERVFEQEFER